MSNAIGMVELKTVSTGIYAADLMVKTAEVDIIEANTVCPGKYIALITGSISAVKSAVEAVKIKFEAELIDSFLLGNPHISVIPAIYGTSEIENKRALGVLETFSAASIIVAADSAAKSADVQLIELRIAKGMCGKSYMLLTGEIAAVSAAVEKAKSDIESLGMFLDSSIIANPDEKIWETIL